MTTRKQLYNGWFMAALSAVMLVCGICIEKKVNDTWLNSSLLEGRSRGIVFFIELSKKVFDTGDRDLMRRFLEDSYTRREQLGKGADSEDFLVFWTNWETDADEAMRARRGLSPSALLANGCMSGMHSNCRNNFIGSIEYETTFPRKVDLPIDVVVERHLKEASLRLSERDLIDVLVWCRVKFHDSSSVGAIVTATAKKYGIYNDVEFLANIVHDNLIK